MFSRTIVILTFLLISLVPDWAFTTEIPQLNSLVMDRAGVLSNRVERGLAQALLRIKRQHGHELAVLTINSLDGNNIEEHSIAIVDQWQLGQKGKDNGLLFLVAIDDRKMRIEVGRGLEGDIPDVIAGRIIREIKPYFKKGDYQSGILAGMIHITQRLGLTLKGTPRPPAKPRSGGISLSSLFFLFLMLATLFGRRGGGILPFIMMGSMMGGGGRGGFGGGGFSGGGSFGGGGGFSGGGASGGW